MTRPAVSGPAVTRPAVTGPAVTGSAVTGSADLHRTVRAMATDVHVRVVRPAPAAAAAVDRAVEVFARVEAACTRFDPGSPLMRANARPRDWHEVPAELYAALAEAARAHQETGGLFDPRVLPVLRSYGYDRTLPFHDGPVELLGPPGPATGRHRQRPPGEQPAQGNPVPGRPWRPGLDPERQAVRIGPVAVDLGGIGKGLAVRWAAERLTGVGSASLVEAGGDLFAAGPGPDGDGWRVAVEDPAGGAEPVAVLRLVDAACATSSIRIRKWTVGGRTVHHLIDPRTGEAGGGELLAVTVVGADPAWAEVWSKALFLTGRGGLRQLADERGLAALWVDGDGTVGTSRAAKPYLLWQAAQ